MEITYKRELKHNYLIISPEEPSCGSYELRMMASNCIDGLLKFHVKQVDDNTSFYYEITSRQPLARLLEVQSLGAEELRLLMEGIAHTLGRLESYLLQEEQILLEPDYIYVEPERFTVFLCLIPGRKGDFPGDMTSLLQYLLGKVNHQDKECVVMAYGLYQESLKENYGIEDLLRLTESAVSANQRDCRQTEDRSGQWERAEQEVQENGVCSAEKAVQGEWKKQSWGDQEYEAQKGTNRRRGNQEEENREWRSQKQGAQEKRGQKKSDQGIGDWEKKNQEKRNVGKEFQGRENLKAESQERGNEKNRRWSSEGRETADKHKVIRCFLFLLTVAAGGPFLIWVIYGKGMVYDLVPVFFAVDGVTAIILVIPWIYIRFFQLVPRDDDAMEAGRDEKNTYYNWEMVFLEEQEQEEPQTERVQGKPDRSEKKEECRTVLLTPEETPADTRCLKSMAAEIPDIVISYVPFIIGKQEGLADGLLMSDAVSRMHARIDREGDEYRITDLNSTNGTIVAGRLLETNETVNLLPGNEVYIANIGFIFT